MWYITAKTTKSEPTIFVFLRFKTDFTLKRIILFTLLGFLLGACAKIVTPTGGPKDELPPKLAKEQPASGAVRFNDRVIKITFDEFFTLNNPTENVLISPPMEKQPEYSILNKSLIIKLKDSLLPNTTYNMVFSNCIQDYHESNKLSYYHYSFSTGDEIDSYMLTGMVKDAQTLAGCDNYCVFLYDRDVDSLPMTTLPMYVTKTQPSGRFTFQNIRPGQYKVFALKDINSNLLYDLPNESIAFADQMFTAYPAPPKDTNALASQLPDSLPQVMLYAFVTSDTVPTLMHYENPAAGHYIFPYKTPVEQFSATALNRDIPHFEIINKTRDTVTWYLKEPLADTLTYLFSADGHVDTVTITPYKSKKTQSRGNKNTASNRLPVTLLNQGHRFEPLTLAFNYPIKSTDSIDVMVISHQKNLKDTTFYRIAVPDSLITRLPLPITFEDKKNYTVILPDSVFIGYNGLHNDTIRCSFVTQSEKDYGSLTMNYEVPGTGFQYIARLWSGKQMVQEDIFIESKQIQYKYLTPGNYSITLIEDRNHNGRWDAGDYRLKLQPEKVIQYPEAINIRGFWENEESFEIPDTRQ